MHFYASFISFSQQGFFLRLRYLEPKQSNATTQTFEQQTVWTHASRSDTFLFPRWRKFKTECSDVGKDSLWYSAVTQAGSTHVSMAWGTGKQLRQLPGWMGGFGVCKHSCQDNFSLRALSQQLQGAEYTDISLLGSFGGQALWTSWWKLAPQQVHSGKWKWAK